MKHYTILCLMIITLGSRAQVDRLREGDIIFQDLDCDLCEAIEAVTTGYRGMDFSHCALVVGNGDSAKVVEAVGKGVKFTGLEEFLKRESKERYFVGRLKSEYQPLVADAVEYAVKQLNEPYDEEFLPDNDSWYCSELIHASFKEANGGEEVFSLEPMTFKDPASGEFLQIWEEYYRNLGIEIPEGVPGINPGGISRSEVLTIMTFQKDKK